MAGGDARRFAKQGDPLNISAYSHNRWQRAADYAERQRDTSSATLNSNLPDGLAYVQNNSGSDRDRFDILGLDGPLIEASDNLLEFQNHIAFKGVMPAAPTHFGKWGVLAEPIKMGKIGLIQIYGATVCRIQLNSADDKCVGIVGGDATQLHSGATGRGQLLVHSADSTGQVWAYINFGVNPDWKNCNVP